jgi:hypothetical protein
MGRDFFLFAETGCGAHLASYRMGIGVVEIFSRG